MSKRLKPSDPHFDVPEVAACNCCRFGTVAFRLVGERKERADLLDREAKPPAMSDESKAANIRSAVGAPSRGGAQGAGEETNILVERSEEHTSELQSLMRITYAVFCLKKKKRKTIKEERKKERKQSIIKEHTYHNYVLAR